MPNRNRNDRADEFMRQVDLGEYLSDLRQTKGVSLAKMGAALDVSANHLSEIERGRKSPSDTLIRSIAIYFEINEDILFRKLDRIPLHAFEELLGNVGLQSLLSEINRNTGIEPEVKERLYEQFRRVYNEFISG